MKTPIMTNSTQICSLGIALQKRRAVLYGDMISQRLQEFFHLLDAFKRGCVLMNKIRDANMPAMLKEICYSTEQGGRFPGGILALCEDFKKVGAL